ncbi:terminase large subunit domain-containing protein, partial [Pseudomonas sp. SIMBA_021]
MRDLRSGHKRGLVFDLESANRAIGFFEDVLCLNGGEYEGLPFILAPWQAFIVGSLFGWKTEDGYRRFRIAYIETAKGSGKSPLAAGIG